MNATFKDWVEAGERVEKAKSEPPVRVQQVVQPHPVGYHTWNPGEGHKATQLTIGREVLGLYWHVSYGFKPTRRHKPFPDERDAKIWVLKAALNHHKAKLASIEAELVRLNSD